MTLVLEANAEAIERAGEIIRKGGLVAFPTETVYGLGADVFNEQAVARVFEVKDRPANNPLPVQIASKDDLPRLVSEVPLIAERLMEEFWPGPLTLVFSACPRVPELVAAGTGKIGIRMPDHPVALALIEAGGTPIVAPSANVSGEPPPTTAQEVLEYLDGKIELILDAGPTRLKVASTVVDVTETPPKILRIGSISEEELQKSFSENL
ncbi:MAG TPA: L-threonylcarbamoyladenylate synthase [Armatimonadota bacterium]|nr:L-threonylcarbamoyladenylate synthase [Armatimonadota bacterium]